MPRPYGPPKHPLPSPKFKAKEREAWNWLHDCDIRPWLVDLLNKTVTTPNGEFENLVEYAKSEGWKY